MREDYTNGRLSKEEMQDYYQGYKVRCEEAEASIQQLERKMEEIICEQIHRIIRWIERFCTTQKYSGIVTTYFGKHCVLYKGH